MPASVESLDVELSSDASRLAICLDVEVLEWPPRGGEWDRAAMEHFRTAIESDSFDSRLGPFYVVHDGALVANAGFFGPPDEDLEVEVGYSVCQHFRRRGIATAAIAELCQRAAVLGCSSVRARVRRDNIGSIKALEHNGFVGAILSGEHERILLRRSLN